MKLNEAQPKAPITITLKPEGYLRTDDLEFLELLENELRNKGFDPDNLIFSGFEGSAIKKGGAPPRYPYIFGMNAAGWRHALSIHEPVPSAYADFEVPCIGVYDKSQLCEVYSGNIDQEEDPDTRASITDIELGEALNALPSDKPVLETVVHKDFPSGSPTDALVGLVFFE